MGGGAGAPGSHLSPGAFDRRVLGGIGKDRTLFGDCGACGGML